MELEKIVESYDSDIALCYRNLCQCCVRTLNDYKKAIVVSDSWAVGLTYMYIHDCRTLPPGGRADGADRGGQ